MKYPTVEKVLATGPGFYLQLKTKPSLRSPRYPTRAEIDNEEFIRKEVIRLVRGYLAAPGNRLQLQNQQGKPEVFEKPKASLAIKLIMDLKQFNISESHEPV